MEGMHESLLELVRMRNEKYYAWLRHLLLLSAGALTLLVSLKNTQEMGMLARWSLRTAWVSLGLGILALGIAQYGEVRSAAALARKAKEEILDRSSAGGLISDILPEYYLHSAVCAYIALATTVVALVVHGIACTL